MLVIYQKCIGSLLALSFITAVLFGLSVGMETRQDGTMSGCLFDQSLACPMNYDEHIDNWQQTFVATQPTQNTVFALLVVIALGGAALLPFFLLRWQRYALEGHFALQSVHRQREMMARLSNHILRTLSDGILNPKLYNFTYATR